MKKRPSPRTATATESPDLFAGVGHTPRRQRALILPRFLAEEAEQAILQDEAAERGAHDILKKWADQYKQGQLAHKETALDAAFLLEVFGQALGYPSITESPDNYQLARNFTVPGVGTADGALGLFGTGKDPKPVAVIELKGIEADLDRSKFNGRTPVQQCWDYLNALPECPWGIVSNFVTTRLYHRNKTPQAYQEFRLPDLHKPEVFKPFYCLFAAGAFIPGYAGQQPRAVKLLKDTADRQKEVGEELYETYRDNRNRLIEHLRHAHGKTLEEAIHVAQKLLDRIIFIAFCEDRALLRENTLRDTYNSVPPHSPFRNPRWQNFRHLFTAIDKGSPGDPFINTGYNGGLFRPDPLLDGLDLEDFPWTDFFKNLGTYDFRDEVNVEVLGNFFERSVGELEQVRVSGGLFGESGNGSNGNGTKPAMQKSAERKRFGIYYTPPEFTAFIVENTVGTLIDEQQKEIRTARKITDADLAAEQPSPVLAGYWRECLDRLRRLTVCDPACGSGAFLIQAYDLLEDRYRTVVENLAFHTGQSERALLAEVPGYILKENLYGVDLSEQAVEITQLALWLRTADPGKPLADLSNNIVWGNSLVTDPAVHPKAMRWAETFPGVFGGVDPSPGPSPKKGGEKDSGPPLPPPSLPGKGAGGLGPTGFSAVIGNPPWERMKLQEREFFAFSAPKIAGAVHAATRRKLIAELEQSNPDLYARYTKAVRDADAALTHVRTAGEFPLTAKGDINTYMLFAELARKIVAPHGRVGLLVPSGIATDNTTREFFADLMDRKALAGLYDFENRLGIFPDVDGRFKFSALLFGGSAARHPSADFVFFAHRMDELQDKKRHIALSAADMALLNPNTRTCPIFRTRRDTEITKAIYRRVPVLIDKSREEGGNPWGIKFSTMFHQTNDADLFRSPEQLQAAGFKLKGNRWVKGKEVCLPLYEAKMIQAYDHRAASVVIEEGNWVRQGQTEETSLVAHQNPEFVVQPRWWVDEADVMKAIKVKRPRGFIGFKDITSPTNQRTMIAAAIPWAAVTNHFPLVLTTTTARREMCLLANLNSLILDYIVRQKIGGVTLNFFIVEQLPILPPDRYDQKCPWDKKRTLEGWVSDRVLKLTCTANDMKPLAAAAGFDPPVHKWNPTERAELLAELDAAYFHLYGIGRDDAAYILGTFQGLRDDGAQQLAGHVPQMQRILDAFDRLAG